MIAVVFLLLALFSGAAHAQVVSPFLQSKSINTTGAIPNGAPPQIIGYSATNTPESETVVGDLTFARTGVNQYTATVGSINGVAIGPLATLSAGTGLTANSTTLSLTVPVAVALGGSGTTTAPTTTGQLLLSQSASAYAPMTMSGDATINSGGVITVAKLNGTTPGGTCTGSQFVSSINSSGVPLCTNLPVIGIPNGSPPQFLGYSAAGAANVEAETLGGGNGSCTFTRTGANAYALNCGYVLANSPTFTGTVTLPDGSTWNSSGLTGGTASFTTLSPTTINATTINVNNSAGKYTAVNGAVYQQPAYNGTTFPAYWDLNGLQSIEAIGIGTPVGADPLDIIRNQNSLTAIVVSNNSNAAGANAQISLQNGSNSVALQMQGTGNSTNPNQAMLYSNQGLIYDSHNGQQHQFEINDTLVGYFATNGLHLSAPLEIASGGLGTSTSPTLGQVPYASTAGHYVPTNLASNNLSDTVAPAFWTPTLGYYNAGTGTCVSTGWGYGTTTAGWYTKVGKMVLTHFYITLTVKGTGSGNVCIAGFPVAAYAYTIQPSSSELAVNNLNLTTGVTGINASLVPNTTIALLYQQFISGGTSGNSTLTDVGISSTSIIQGTMVYTSP